MRRYSASFHDVGAGPGLVPEPDDRSGFSLLTAKSSSKQLCQSRVLDRTDDLAMLVADRGKDLREMQRPVVVNMLNRIVQN